jgi:spoIIIJ-associated protein
MVVLADYRKTRRAALERFATGVADKVKEAGVATALEPMNPADRKVVHDTVNGIDGVTTTSEGEEPNRRVVIMPEDA